MAQYNASWPANLHSNGISTLFYVLSSDYRFHATINFQYSSNIQRMTLIFITVLFLTFLNRIFFVFGWFLLGIISARAKPFSFKKTYYRNYRTVIITKQENDSQYFYLFLKAASSIQPYLPTPTNFFFLITIFCRLLITFFLI